MKNSTNEIVFETAHQSASGQPLVSVIIPAYNVEDYIGRAIESALQQTVSNIEIVVVDDASTDGTLAIINDFAARDPRIKAISCRENGGAAVARNIGIDAANGEWVCPMDADDWFSQNRLSALLAGTKDDAVDMIADDFYLVDYDSLEPLTTFSQLNGRSFEQRDRISASFFVNQSNKALGHGSSPGFLKPLMRRSFLNEHGLLYRKTVRVTHDFFLYLDCLIAGAQFSFLHEPHYFYLVRPGSLCRSSNDGQLEKSRTFIDELRSRLADERVEADSELKAALLDKLGACERRLAYQTVAVSVNRKNYFQAVSQALRHPLFFVHLARMRPVQKIRKVFS